ncbi:SIR2 family protein [Microbacterium sp. MYb62]|uniref:P-loop NTPase n=1 Tax=Microbacterium sp. MYb62 TaxID=1848690 RepID=UPI000CFCD10D|nr:SIR2 family protein [Microbacterium sp. MYb62]PRB14752.1 hypothetical protein CQ042_10070 [Microbacterium sp. MYb62]
MTAEPGSRNDLKDLRERLTHIAQGGAGTLLTVVGSGVSRGSVASTQEMTERFLIALSDSVAQGLRARWAADTPDYLKYQQAAEAVSRQRGDKALTSIIRAAVLEALDEDWQETDDVRTAVRERRWKLPKAHRDLAEFYARLPAEIRGPIITTNFDPLIEVALRGSGLIADPIPVSFDDPPSRAHLRNMMSVPVIHIHGYFAEPWSINALNQIAAPRAKLEELLSALFTDANVLVLGYGGWEDSFMRVLERHAASPSVLSAEVVWCSHAPKLEEAGGSIQRLHGMPGFHVYSGIDAATLFDAPIGLRAASPTLASPRGWTRLPVQVDEYRPPREFFEGAQPSWSDGVAGRWPLLSPGRELLFEARSRMSSGTTTAGLVALGPIGEGKSMALRQVAMELAGDTDWTVLWRAPGAPALSEDWLANERPSLGSAVFCIDEADLARSDIEVLLRADRSERTILLLASHDRLWWSLPASVTRQIDPVLFDGLSDTDAALLAEGWDSLGITIRRGDRELVSTEVREDLIAKARAQHHQARSTLFGAVLAVHESKALSARIDELMNRLVRTPARAGTLLTLADVFGAICFMQATLDSNGANLRGATRVLVGEMVNFDDSLENVSVLNALGREASITFAGRHVYARHPIIAQHAVDWLRKNGRLTDVAEACARAGARLRVAGAERADYQDAYLLGKSIDDTRVARAACTGAIKGAPELLEPRITYLSVTRKTDSQHALEYAKGIIPLLTTTQDSRSAIRVYLNELARIELLQNHARLGLGVAGLILHNGAGHGATREQVGYGIGTMASAFRVLHRQSPQRYSDGIQVLERVASQILGAEDFRRYVGSVLPSLPRDPMLERLPLMAGLQRLARHLSPFSVDAISQLGLPFGSAPGGGKFSFHGGLDFSEIRHYEISP